jgi:dolichol kinase
MDSAGTAMAALPCFGQGNLSLAGIVAGSVVVVVVVVVVVDVARVVVEEVVVVVEEVVVVVDRAIAGVITTSVATNRPLTPRVIKGPRRSNDRGDNFTHLTYFACQRILVTGP